MVNICVATCPVFQYVKFSIQAPIGLLHPLSIPQKPFDSIRIDFVRDFIEVSITPTEGTLKYNIILRIVDKLTKLVNSIPCFMGEAALTAQKVVKLVLEYYTRYYKVPKTISHYRDPRFTSEV